MIEAVDLRRLQVLRMIREHGTVTAAAAALHLTPSAVSHQMRQLSSDIGVPVLEPDGRRIRLTAAGRRLVQHADDLLAGWERITADLESLGEGGVGELRMCGFPTAVAGLLAPAAQQLAGTDPGLEVHLTEVDDASTGFELLLGGATDIALVTPLTESPPLDDPRYDQQLLLTEPLDLLVGQEHPLGDRATVPLAELADESWILAAPGSWDCRQLVANACASAGFSPRIVHEAYSPLAVSALVERDLGVALVPRLAPIPAHHHVRRIPLAGDPPPQRTILTCVRRGSDHQPAIARGLEALRAAAAALPAPLWPAAVAADHTHASERQLHRHAG